MDTNETNLGTISNMLSQLSRIPKHSEQIYILIRLVQSNISNIKYVVNILQSSTKQLNTNFKSESNLLTQNFLKKDIFATLEVGTSLLSFEGNLGEFPSIFQSFSPPNSSLKVRSFIYSSVEVLSSTSNFPIFRLAY